MIILMAIKMNASKITEVPNKHTTAWYQLNHDIAIAKLYNNLIDTECVVN